MYFLNKPLGELRAEVSFSRLQGVQRTIFSDTLRTCSIMYIRFNGEGWDLIPCQFRWDAMPETSSRTFAADPPKNVGVAYDINPSSERVKAMKKQTGERNFPLWLLGDSEPDRWRQHLEAPLDSRHPIRLLHRPPYLLQRLPVRQPVGYYSFAGRAGQVEEQAESLLRGKRINQTDSIKLIYEYQLARASAPIIPEWIWKWRRNELNGLWAEFRQKTEPTT